MWIPPPTITEHQGEPIAPDRDFFVVPPIDIGPVRTAHTSLKQGVVAKSPPVRLAIALAWGAVGFLLAMGLQRFTALLYIPSGLTHTPIVLWEIIIAILPAYLGWRKSAFKHFCNFVGDGGCAQYTCEGDRGTITENSVFRFQNAVSLSTSTIRHIKNGRYTYTNFYYNWYGADDQSTVYSIAGSHSADMKTPPAGNPYNFARAAENAWYAFVAPRIQSELAHKGFVKFRMGRDRWTVVGPGFIEITEKNGKVSRCEAGDIGSAKLDAGFLTIARQGAKPSRFDLFSPEGVFRYDYSVVHNARMFLYVFEKCLGCRVA